MHINLLEVLGRRFLVLFGTKSSQTFISDESMHLIVVDTSDNDVDPEVKLEAVYEEWVVNVPLHHHLIFETERQLGCVSEQNNVVTLSTSQRLSDVCCLLVLSLIGKELVFVCWQSKRRWYKVEGVLIKVGGDGHHVLEAVLPPEIPYVRISIDYPTLV